MRNSQRRSDSTAEKNCVVPRLEVLDDRITPSHTGGLGGGGGSAGPATHFLVETRESAVAGDPTQVRVIALDASNHVAKGYTGTVAVTSSDADAVNPGDLTFSSSARGALTFQETFNTTGTDSVTVTDTTTSSITGTASLTVNPAPVATHFAIQVSHTVYANEPTQVTVVALDANNHPVKNYTGTVAFSSTDMAATLPANYTFTSSDAGKHTFTVTMGTTGTESLTVTDTTTSTVTGIVSFTVSPEQVATHFAVYETLGVGPVIGVGGVSLPWGPVSVRNELWAPANEPISIAVVALDANNKPVLNYAGTVDFTSSDTAATLPAAYTFTTADQGAHTFSVTFATAGSQTLTVSDANTSTLTDTVKVNVVSLPVIGVGPVTGTGTLMPPSHHQVWGW